MRKSSSNLSVWIIGAAIIGGASLVTVLWPGSQATGPRHAQAKGGPAGFGYNALRDHMAYNQQETTPPSTTPPASTSPSETAGGTSGTGGTGGTGGTPTPEEQVAGGTGGGAAPTAVSPPPAQTSWLDSSHMSDPLLAGPRGWLSDHGVAFDATAIYYLGDNWMGGATTTHGGSGYIFLFNVALDSQKLAGYEGGTFFVNFLQMEGLTHTLDGSWDLTSYLYVPKWTSVSEIWYQQKFVDDKVRVKIGKIDANADFGYTDYGGDFLNRFADFSATILNFPTGPNQAMGVVGFVNPDDHFYVGAGLFDGSNAQGISTGELGLQTGFKSGFLISEAGDKWTMSNGRDGRLSAGLWYHSGQLAHVADNGYDNGAVGGYATFDQMLWRAEPDKAGDKKGLAMFAIAGYANPRTNADNWDLTGGLEWRGLIPTRDNDVIGAAVSTIRLNDAPGSGLADNNQETIEGFYKVSVAKWLSVEPDLQYIHNPGAITTQHDGLMFTLEVVADF